MYSDIMPRPASESLPVPLKQKMSKTIHEVMHKKTRHPSSDDYVRFCDQDLAGLACNHLIFLLEFYHHAKFQA